MKVFQTNQNEIELLLLRILPYDLYCVGVTLNQINQTKKQTNKKMEKRTRKKESYIINAIKCCI
jgi:hypothetical protein